MSVLTYNLLAPCYYRCAGRQRESSDAARFLARWSRCIAAVRVADVMAFQEVWFAEPRCIAIIRAAFPDHTLHMLRRPRGKEDGVAVLVRSSIAVTHRGEFCFQAGGRRVALALALRIGGRSIVVCTTHLTFPHREFDAAMRLRQAALLVELLDRFELYVHAGDAAAAAEQHGITAGEALDRAGREFSFIYRYILRESCSQFDSLPLTYLTISAALDRAGVAREAATGLDARGATLACERVGAPPAAPAARASTILCGDMNGDMNDSALRLLAAHGGFASAFRAANGCASGATHASHEEQQVGVDFALTRCARSGGGGAAVACVKAVVLPSASVSAIASGRVVIARPPAEDDGRYESDHLPLRFEFQLC